MGRGLSKLQRHILVRANQQRRLFHAEILVEFFGWKPWRPIVYEDGPLTFVKGTVQRPGLRYSPGQLFSPRTIGPRRYNSDRASLSRACERLQRRGLVECLQGVAKWSAVEITDAGRAWLSVNKVPHVDHLNR